MSDLKSIGFLAALIFAGIFLGILLGGPWWTIPLLAFAVPFFVILVVLLYILFTYDWSH